MMPNSALFLEEIPDPKALSRNLRESTAAGTLSITPLVETYVRECYIPLLQYLREFEHNADNIDYAHAFYQFIGKFLGTLRLKLNSETKYKIENIVDEVIITFTYENLFPSCGLGYNGLGELPVGDYYTEFMANLKSMTSQNFSHWVRDHNDCIDEAVQIGIFERIGIWFGRLVLWKVS